MCLDADSLRYYMDSSNKVPVAVPPLVPNPNQGADGGQ